MRTKHFCPLCGGKQFYTVAHIMQEWIVNENGDFLTVSTELCGIDEEPDDGNAWVCVFCGGEGISVKNISRIKKVFAPGTRIRLIKMGDDPNPIPDYTVGTVVSVDDIGTIHCHFDNGRALGVIPGVDIFKKL